VLLLRRLLLSLLSLVLGLGAALLVVPSASGSVTYLCTGYDRCAKAGMSHAGYKSAASKMYWRMYSGHNCTNYAAYRMVQSGLPNARPWSGGGNAEYWGTSMASITNSTPTVGSVAWWAENVKPAGRSGHVAYVEQVVSADEIIVSQDSWGGDFSWARITRSGGGWPSGFIHFNDAELTRSAAPTVMGTAKVGEVLSASAGSWSPDPSTYTYQWRADGVAIPGATASTLTITPELEGRQISVQVKASKPGYRTVAAASPRTPVVLPGEITNTKALFIKGTPQVDRRLTLDIGAWNPVPDAVTYQWSADGQPIAGATGTTLIPTPDLVDKTLAVTATATRAGYVPVSASTAATGPVVPGVLKVTGEPALTGVPRLGDTLTLDPGRVDRADATTTVEWLRDGVPVAEATGTTYRLTADDLGAKLRARVTHTKPGYTTLTLLSAKTARAKSYSKLRLTAEQRGRHRVRITVTVKAAGVPAVGGVVRIRSGRTVLAELTLRQGVRAMTLREVPYGKLTIKAHYPATPTVTAARTERTIRLR
jgi:surface antigen